MVLGERNGTDQYRFEILFTSGPRSPIPVRFQSAQSNRRKSTGSTEIPILELKQSLHDEFERKAQEADLRRGSLREKRTSKLNSHLQLVEQRRNEWQSKTEKESVNEKLMECDSKLKLAHERRLEQLQERAARAAMFSPFKSPAPIPSEVYSSTAPSASTPAAACRRLVFAEESDSNESCVDHNPVLTRKDAAVIIQRRFRLKNLQSSMSKYSNELFDGTSLSFEELTEWIQTPEMIECVRFNVLPCIYSPTQLKNLTNARGNRLSRIVLSAFLVAFHSNVVFDKSSRQLFTESERKVAESARLFVAILVCCSSSGHLMKFGEHSKSITLLRSFWKEWSVAFTNWKAEDGEKLISGLISDALATMALRQSVLQNATDDERIHWQHEIDSRMNSIRNAVRRVGGISAESRFDERMQEEDQKLALESMFAESNENDRLLHALYVDSEQVLQGMNKKTINSFQSRIENQMKNAFWNNLKENLLGNEQDALENQHENEDQRVLCVNEIFMSMYEVLESIQSGNALNSAVIEAKLKVNVKEHGLEMEILRVVEVLKSFQAANDDTALENWVMHSVEFIQNHAGTSQEYATNVVRILRELMEKIENVQVECARARIRMLIPIVMKHYPDLERRRIQSKFGSNSAAFSQTLEWLRRCASNLPHSLAELSGSFNVDLLRRGNHRALLLFTRASIVSLVEQSLVDSSNAVSIPELLYRDIERLERARFVLRCASIVCALKSIGTSLLRSKFQQNSAFSLASVVEVFMNLESDDFLIQSQVQNAVFTEYFGALRAASGDNQFSQTDQDFIKSMVIKICTLETDAVYMISRRRCVELVYESVIREQNPNAFTGQFMHQSIAQEALVMLDPECRSLSKLSQSLINIHGDVFLALVKNSLF